ncbi:hypothetical protein EG329_011392 [Mollisiaceae sp. DMI_Dod_QoI]|nr:hypothetical protein EG329_011392 [Helotiales sp. DMI_Dod_QoI]
MSSYTVTAPVTICSESYPGLNLLLPPFLSASTTPSQMQNIVRQTTSFIVSHAFPPGATLSENVELILIPILRAALPMYVAAQTQLSDAGCVLVRCKKAKGSKNVSIEWLGEHPVASTTSLPQDYGKHEVKRKQIILLDTVIATGDTIVSLCDEFRAGDAVRGCVTVLACYASPESVEVVKRHEMVGRVVVGFLSESVDKEGYLIPYTNGDVGDKMFGKVNV